MLSLADDAPPIGIEALKTNVSTTVKAAIHMGQNDHENLENFRYTNFKELQNLFQCYPEVVVAPKSGDFECDNRLSGHLPHGRDLRTFS